jgi:ubiquinone/menaquinone biosynthesis C-methylase UbiE
VVSDCYEPLVADRKERLTSELCGTIIDIGAGTGANARYLRPGTRWIAIEPNIYMHERLRRRAEIYSLQLEIQTTPAERLSGIADSSVNTVIGTLVLCSVAQPGACLSEIQRILKPGGVYIFLEHVAAPHGSLLRVLQRSITPVWKCILGGCCLNRDTAISIESAGFSGIEIERFQCRVPLIRPHIVGRAFK